MKENKYLLPANYRSLENELFRALRVLKAERNTEGKDLQDMVNDYEQSLLGAQDACASLRRMVKLFTRLVGISSCALRDLEDIHREHPDIKMMSSVRSKEPGIYVAEAAMLLPELSDSVVERITNAIIASHELFIRSLLDTPMAECFPDYSPDGINGWE